MKIVRYFGRQYHGTQIGTLGSGEETGDSLFLMVYAEDLVQSRLADVEPHDDDFLAQ